MQSVRSINARGQFEKIKKTVLELERVHRRQFTKSGLQLPAVRAQR